MSTFKAQNNSASHGPSAAAQTALNSPSFTGIWPAMLSPLKADLSLDVERFTAHAKALLAAGCGGLTPFGTTGEVASFSVAERMQGLEALVNAGIPPARIMCSTSAAAVADVITLTRDALSLGVHGCLMLPPFYFKGVSEQGVINAYRQVIDAATRGAPGAPFRLYLYNLPQVCAVPVTHTVIETLQREYPGVIAGIKDSQGDRAHSVGLVERFGASLPVYVGNEPDLRTLGRLGSSGAISGLANFWPKKVWQLVSQPDTPGTEVQERMVKALLAEATRISLIPALKAVMAWASGDENWLRVRAPLVAYMPAQAAELRQALSAAGVSPND